MSWPRPTYSGVVSTLALVLALSGGAYAATALPRNSVGAKQIKKSAVETAKIKPGAVDGSKLKAGVVDASKLAPGAVDATKLTADAIDGSKVKDGSLSGADLNLTTLGTVNAAKTAGTSVVASIANSIGTLVQKTAPGSTTTFSGATATCDAGMRVTGGGVRVSDPQVGNVIDSYPDGQSAWTARVYSGDGTTVTFTVYALCTPVT